MRLGHRILRPAFIFIVLLGAWLLLSGKFDAFHIGWGVAGCAVMGWLAWRWTSERPFPLMRVLLFVPWHLWQVLMSNLRVARLVLRPSLPIQPRLLRREPGSTDPRALTLLGCAITLTPGTLTVDITPNAMVVHALDDASAQDIREAVMAERVQGVFQGVDE